MGKNQPRRRKATRIYQPMLKSWVSVMQRLPRGKQQQDEALQEDEQPERVNAVGKARQLVSKIWHMSDDFHWMSPLPPMHRRWILVSALVVLVALLWPYSPKNTYAPSDKPVSIPMQAELNNQPNRTVPTTQQPQANNQPVATPVQTAPPSPPPQPQDNANWKSYRVQSGQTLAQLFRDNNLNVNDVFSMAQVEGSGKPLSNLRTGQEVKIQRNAQGAVSELEVTTDQNDTIRFTRKADGSYQRSR